MMVALKGYFRILIIIPGTMKFALPIKKNKKKGRVISDLIVIYTNCYELEN